MRRITTVLAAGLERSVEGVIPTSELGKPKLQSLHLLARGHYRRAACKHGCDKQGDEDYYTNGFHILLLWIWIPSAHGEKTSRLGGRPPGQFGNPLGQKET